MKPDEILIRVEYHEAYNSHIVLLTTPSHDVSVFTSLNEEELESKKDDIRFFVDLVMNPDSRYLSVDRIRADRFHRLFSLKGKVVEVEEGSPFDVELALLDSDEKDFLVLNWQFSESVTGAGREEMSGEHIYPFNKGVERMKIGEETLTLMHSHTSHRTAANGWCSCVEKNKIIPETSLVEKKYLLFVA